MANKTLFKDTWHWWASYLGAVVLVGAGERMNLRAFTQGGCNSFGPELYFKLSDRYKDHLTHPPPPHFPLCHHHLLMNSHLYPVCDFLLHSSYHHLHDFSGPIAQTSIVLGSPTSITLNIPCSSYSQAAFWILSPMFGSLSNTWLVSFSFSFFLFLFFFFLSLFLSPSHALVQLIFTLTSLWSHFS